jgi:hypothetical protein
MRTFGKNDFKDFEFISDDYIGKSSDQHSIHPIR